MTEWIITSSVLIVIVAVLRFLLRGKISLRLQYALWALVLIRLILPFSLFESPISVLNFLVREETAEPPAVSEPYVPEKITPYVPAVPDEDIFILDDNIEYIEPEINITVDNGYVTEPEIKVFSLYDVLYGIWIAGVAVFGIIFLSGNLRFALMLKKSRRPVLIESELSVYSSAKIKTPCLFGIIKPSIYVTEAVLGDEKILRHVLEHETTHRRHGDHIWSVLRCFCLALHWYNPFVWLAAFLSMRDAELACDEATIKRIGESERIGYGRTLISLTVEKPAVGILSSATTMTGSKSGLKERITLIAKKPKMLKITATVLAIIAVAAVGCTFTGAVKYNPKTTDEPAVETFSNKIEPGLSGLDGTIRMTVTAASQEEITTEIFNETSEEIYYRISYSLYFEQDGKWYILPKINDNNEFDFGTKVIESGKTGLWESDIKEIYGKLPDGKYCINRTVNFGDMDFFENEFYVIGAEFILEDGKLVYKEPPSLAKGNYKIIEERIFHNFLSSTLEIPERIYQITENAFSVYVYASKTEIETIPVSDWRWEEFPYSEEEWSELFIIGLDFPDISQYQSRYYQPIDERRFIASLDGELWLVETAPITPTSEEYMVWSIYEIAPEEETEEDFYALAEEMGYSGEHLRILTEAGISEETILSVANIISFGEKSTENGKYSLGSFDFDKNRDGLNFVYVRTSENEKIHIINDFSENTVFDAINNEYFFCYSAEKGLVIYSFEHLKAVEEWIPSSAEDKKYWESGFAFVPEEEKILIFGIETSPDFSFDAPLASDVAATYYITLFDIKNSFSTVIDTGIEIHRDGYNKPADAYFEDCPFKDIEADFAFAICDRCYSLDFDTLEIEMVHDHAFAEEYYRFPPAPKKFDIGSADPILLKYYEFFGPEIGYLGDYSEEDGFDPKSAAMYILDKYAEDLGETIGVPKEKFIEISEKSFGFNVLERTDFCIDNGSGFIVPSGGYSPSPSAFVLKDRTENDDGSLTAVFYFVGLDFYSNEFYENVLRGASVDELLLSGQFGYFSGYIELFEVTFFERTDENGEFYAEYLSAKSLGYIPEDVYNTYISKGVYPVYGS
ncbi:MAG: hypothetical protein IJ306_08835 [Oscillospiraceae bacterium]|nr:hypothetical protein [Oscillospiraceae bacterium]